MFGKPCQNAAVALLNEPIAATHVAAAVSAHEPSMNTTSVPSPASLISPARPPSSHWPMARCSGADQSVPPDRPPPKWCSTPRSPATGNPHDPSHAGQFVTLTYPHIGNVGVNREDVQNRARCLPRASSSATCRRWCQFRAEQPLDAYLRDAGVVGIADIDTRKLTRILRDKGRAERLHSGRHD